MESLKNWMRDTANILFDDSKNDLRSLPKTVRLQILLVLSFIWTTVFSLYVFSYTTFVFGWTGLFLAHIGLIFAVYMTFKHFHRAEHWVVTHGIPRITLNKSKFLKKPGETIYIPLGAVHRIENPFKKPVKIIEAQIGSILKETDIVRYQDIYGRVK